MTGLFFSHGHLAWPLFAALVFTALVILLADFGWRLVQRPARQIAAAVLSFWLLGLIIIFAL